MRTSPHCQWQQTWLKEMQHQFADWKCESTGQYISMILCKYVYLYLYTYTDTYVCVYVHYVRVCIVRVEETLDIRNPNSLDQSFRTVSRFMRSGCATSTCSFFAWLKAGPGLWNEMMQKGWSMDSGHDILWTN